MANFLDCWGKLKAQGYKHADGSEVLNDKDRASIEDRIERLTKKLGFDPDQAAKEAVQWHHDQADEQLQSIYKQAGVAKPVEVTQPTEGGASEKVQEDEKGQGEGPGVLAATEPTAAVEPSTAAAVPATTTGATSVEEMTKPLSETGGPSISAMAERPIKQPEGGTPVGWSESTAHGHEWLDNGGKIEDVINEFKTTGKVNEWDIGKGSAFLERLQANTNAVGDALDKKPTDPKLQAAFNESLKNEQDFSDTFKPMATVASNSLKGFQGKRPLTPEMALSNTGLTRKFIENLRRDPTPEEATKVRQLSEQNKSVSEKYVKDTEALYKAADQAHGITKGVKTPVTAQALAKMFQEPLMEVCDI